MASTNKKQFLLIAAGLIGIACYEISIRLFGNHFLTSDFFHGSWFGVCIGLEILGLLLLRKSMVGGQ